MPLPVAVEETHDPFYDAYVGFGTVVTEDILKMVGIGKPRVEVHALSAASLLMILRVDVVGSALEGLNMQSAKGQHTQQAHREGSLAASRAGGCH